MEYEIGTPSMEGFWDALLAGGGMTVLAILVMLLLLAPFIALVLKDDRFARKSALQRREEKARQYKDVVRRIQRFAELRQQAVSDGHESAEQAMYALQIYAEGVVDSYCCMSRNVSAVEAIRQQVGAEIAAMQAMSERSA